MKTVDEVAGGLARMTIPYRVDPTLHGAPPAPEVMGDGFEPLQAATHPVEPEPGEPDGAPEPAAPNPSRLPIEPEFAPEAEPVEPEDPPLRHKPQP